MAKFQNREEYEKWKKAKIVGDQQTKAEAKSVRRSNRSVLLIAGSVVIVILGIVISFIYRAPVLQKPNTHPFKLAGQYNTTLSILVSSDTTEERLSALIYSFKTARENNTLSKLIPPTTKGGALGDHAIVWIFIFSEPEWANRDKLQRFIDASPKNPSDREFNKEYVPHIKGEYYFAASGSEYGNLGCRDEKYISPSYRVLF